MAPKPLFEELLSHASKIVESLEPNSYRFKAWNYLLKHQSELTLFYKIAGLPLDNNTTERALKRAIVFSKTGMSFTLNLNPGSRGIHVTKSETYAIRFSNRRLCEKIRRSRKTDKGDRLCLFVRVPASKRN